MPGTRVLPPGSCIGVIGGGQLGRMTAIAARQMGYEVLVLDPDPRCPAGQVASGVIASPYSDRSAASELARRSDVVTYEFENIDATVVEAAEAVGRVFPSSKVLRVCQHRVLEKQAVERAGSRVSPFRQVVTEADFYAAVKDIGLPAVLKTATMGYDGKGQAVLRSPGAEAAAAFARLRGQADVLVYERFVPFAKELSVICARGQDGETVCFPCTENVHKDNILDTSTAPADVPPEAAGEASRIATSIAAALDIVGLICVELFLTTDGGLLVNELAPRPHNSGHWTIEGCRTSQFHQLVRALCGLSLGAVDMAAPVAMANLLGDIWLSTDMKPDFARALRVPGASLHLYGKVEPRAGRKMGHITVVAGDAGTALQRAREARARVSGTRS